MACALLCGLSYYARAQAPAPEFSSSAEAAAHLRDADRDARLKAGRRLATDGGASAASSLESAAKAEKDPQVKAVFLGALGRVRPDDATRATLEAALSNPAPVVRLEAVAALGRIPGAKADADLIKALGSDASAEVRQIAALRLSVRPSAAAALARAVAEDSSAGVRLQALQALAAVSKADAAKAAKAAGKDPSEEVRRAAGALSR